MILKIERYWGPAKDDPQDWWMLDDIRKISRYLIKDASFIVGTDSTQELSSELSSLIEGANISLLDYGPYLDKMGMGQSSWDVIRLVCRNSGGEEFIIIFDTIAYIMNDKGETIEKLVANYR